MKIELEKGRGAISLDVPADMIAGVLLGKDVDAVPLDTLKSKVAASLGEQLPDDLSGKKVVVIIPDDTRLWARGDQFVPVIVKSLLAAGVSASNISVIIALGTHADMEADKFPLLAGDIEELGVSIVNSANKDSDRLSFYGRTSRGTALSFTQEGARADHIIIFGGVLHHMLAGYGGGRKYIFPGIAGYDAIQQNHSLAMTAGGGAHPEVRQTRLIGNPVHEDMVEAAEIFLKDKTCTYVAVAANGRSELFHVEVGGLADAFAGSCAQLDRACCLNLDEKQDFALISAGGFRTDGQLYQSTKALFNGVSAVKEGGHILFVAECADGAGNPLFENALKEYRGDSKRLGKKLAASFDMPSYVAYRVIDMLERFTITLVSGFGEEETRELGFEFFENMENYVNNLTGKGYVIPFAENILPIIGQAEENT